MIMSCTCSNKFQDEKYGKDKRVFNVMKGGVKARCSVCLKIVSIPGATKEVVKAEKKKE